VTPVGDTHSINNEKPFELRLGRKFSASAFEDCIQTMKEGEKSLFLCVPDTIIVSFIKKRKKKKREKKKKLY